MPYSALLGGRGVNKKPASGKICAAKNLDLGIKA